jgi:hypothetical protein
MASNKVPSSRINLMESKSMIRDTTKANIIAESRALDGRRIATVRTYRGDEYTFDIDATLKAVAALLSDRSNERRFGWTLNIGWYEQEFDLLSSRVSANHGE